jgi:hypothetical protein
LAKNKIGVFFLKTIVMVTFLHEQAVANFLGEKYILNHKIDHPYDFA